MPLSADCISAIGKSLFVDPVNGYGWIKRETATAKFHTISILPIPFEMHFREPIYIGQTLVGGVGAISPECHRPDDHAYVVFFAWVDHFVDFTMFSSYQVVICSNFPRVAARRDKHPSDWVLNREVLFFVGFAQIGFFRNREWRYPFTPEEIAAAYAGRKRQKNQS